MMNFCFSLVRRQGIVVILVLLGLLSAAPLCLAQAGSAEVTGSVTYLERMALPPDATIDVQLADTSVADIASQIVAESMMNVEGRQVPIPFTLTYDPTKILPSHRYSVRANIRYSNGILMFSTTQAYPVITHGSPSKVNLVLHRVGRTEKESSSARPTKAIAEPSPPPPAATSSEAIAEANPPASAGETTQSETAPPQASAEPPVPAEPAANAATTEQETKPAPPTSAPEAAAEQQTKPAPSAPEPEAASKQAEPEAPKAEATAPEPQPLPEAPSATMEAEKANSSRELESAPATQIYLSPLANTQWKLIQLGGQSIVITPPSRPMTLAFSPEGTRIAGSAGCNSYLGTFSDDHGTLNLDPGGMTLLSCADKSNQREHKFVEMLRSANGYRVQGNFLVLTENGKPLAKFENID